MTKKNKVCFLLELDQKEIIDELTDEEAGKIFKAIYEYEVNKKEIVLEKTLKFVFKNFKIKLDFYDKRYNEICLKNKENADKRWGKNNDAVVCGRIRSNAVDANKRKEKKSKVNKSKENIDSERERIEREKSASHFAPAPTILQVIDYGKELGASENYCQNFYDYYESVGWITGNGIKIKNWKLVLNKWFKKDLENGKIKNNSDRRLN